MIDEILNIVNVDDIKSKIECLADANFQCFQANMRIIELRKDEESHTKWKQISDNEYIARTVGEKRVAAKAEINSTIASLYPKSNDGAISSWTDDDIVYSVGEMIDRILIEDIKQTWFLDIKENEKYKKSRDWQNRVLDFLRKKFVQIRKHGYESIEEMRTY
jgi:hypothetical protein|tara:strand:+ start:55 stop:540 length:486 start_codon:yes stop_codon:yes gene_type:complete